MEKLAKSIYLVNDVITSTSDLKCFNQIDGQAVYELLKVSNNVPLFFEWHMDRFITSINKMGYEPTFNFDKIKAHVDLIIRENESFDCNLKFLYFKNTNGTYTLLVFFVESTFPSVELIREGIKTYTMDMKRENPNIKIQRDWFKDKVRKFLVDKGGYEALLVDENGNVTEGSRSNILFVKDNTIITSQGNTVLLGITRRIVYNILQNNNISIIERVIDQDEIYGMDGAIMTGTGAGVLPIVSIDDKKIPSLQNSIIQLIVKEYNDFVIKYIEDYR